MARPTKGSTYKTVDGVGLRWTIAGRLRCRSGFRDEAEARAWFAENVLPQARPDIPAAISEIRRWARYRRKQGPLEHPSWVYVVAAPDGQAIKIGRTTVPAKRLRALQTASPMPIDPVLMVPGGEDLEAKLLQVTKPFAIDGAGSEWRTLVALEVVIALVRELASGTISLRVAA